MFIRAPYNYDADQARRDASLVCDPEDTRTQQQFAEECDINEIVRRFGLTGVMPENPRLPVSGDFTGVSDFQTAMNAVRAAEEGFMELPAEVRYRFGNDPQRLMSFLEDGRNKDEAIRLGLVVLPPEVPRDVVQAVDELAARFPSPPSA